MPITQWDCPTRYEFHGSEDGNAFNTLLVVDDQTCQNDVEIQRNIANCRPFKFYRLVILDVIARGNGNKFAIIKDLKFFGGDQVLSTTATDLCSRMDIIKLVGHPGASSTYTDPHYRDHAAINAFKPERLLPWANAGRLPATVWFKFLSNVHLNRISFTSRRGRWWKQAPETFNIVGSKDGKNWRELLHIESAGFSEGGQTKTWDVACNDAFFQFVGVKVLKSKSGGSTAITNITMWGLTQEGHIITSSPSSTTKAPTKTTTKTSPPSITMSPPSLTTKAPTKTTTKTSPPSTATTSPPSLTTKATTKTTKAPTKTTTRSPPSSTTKAPTKTTTTTPQSITTTTTTSPATTTKPTTTTTTLPTQQTSSLVSTTSEGSTAIMLGSNSNLLIKYKASSEWNSNYDAGHAVGEGYWCSKKCWGAFVLVDIVRR